MAVSYRGHSVNVPPPPCEGYQYLLTLRILDGFDLARMKRNSTEHVDTVLRAIRDNPDRVPYLGYNPFWYKLVAYILAAQIAAFGGLIYPLLRGFVGPDLFGPSDASIYHAIEDLELGAHCGGSDPCGRRCHRRRQLVHSRLECFADPNSRLAPL